MSNILSTLDILGPEIKLQIKNKNTFKTNSGGFFTIILILLSLLSFIAFGRDIFEKKYPEIIFSKEVISDSKFNIDNSSVFMFGFADLSLGFIKERSKKMSLYILVQETDPERGKQGGTAFNETRYSFEQCTEDRIPHDVIKNGLILPVNQYYCFPQNITFKLRGQFNNGKAVTIKFNVDICKNTTNNNQCYPDSFIRSNLSVFNMYYVVSDGFLKGQDYEYPGKTVYTTGITKTNSETFSRTFFYYKNIEYITDIGWIFEDYRTDNYTFIEKISQEVFPTPGGLTMYSHIISCINLKDVYRRKYIKIQGVFAYIGGFIQFFRIVLTLLNAYISYPKYLEIFYEFYLEKEKKRKINPDQSRLQLKLDNQTNKIKLSTTNNIMTDKISTTKNNFVRNNGENLNDISNILEKEHKKSENYFKPKLTLTQLLFRGCCCKKNKNSIMLKRLEQLFAKKISVEKLTKINRKLEILEFLIYDDYQKILSKKITVHKYNFLGDELTQSLTILQKNLKNEKINKKIFMNLNI